MGRMGQEESDYKTQLVLKICSISNRFVVCAHTLVSSPPYTPFIDWYCVIGVDENAGVNSIRKEYHKLALNLHPDKNKHPKAEIAFKLVSEAYTCLSDATKRKAFNLERSKKFCFECKRIPYTSSNLPCNANVSSSKAWNIISKSRSSKVLRNIKEMRERLKEESKVIENCLKANSMSRKESPLFNPADYVHGSRSNSNHKYLFQGYPHHRGNVYKDSSEKCRYLQAEKCASPVFEVKSQRSMLTRKFAYVPS